MNDKRYFKRISRQGPTGVSMVMVINILSTGKKYRELLRYLTKDSRNLA